MTTVAGDGVAGYVDSPQGATDGSGVRFHDPAGVAIGSNGLIYVVDSYNSVIRELTLTGITATLAGSGHLGSTDGIGTNASFTYPSQISADAYGNVFVTDRPADYGQSSRVREISTTNGTVNTIWDRPAGDNTVYSAIGISPNHIVYIFGSCGLAAISSAGRSILTPAWVCGDKDGTLGTGNFGYFGSIAVDTLGNLYLTDGNKIRKISPVP